MSLRLRSFQVYLSCSQLRWDYTANSNFLSSQTHQNPGARFFRGLVFPCNLRDSWKLWHFISITTGISLSTTPGLVLQYLHVHTRETPRGVEHVCVCAGEDSGCMWRQRLSFKRFSFHPGQLYHSPVPRERETETERTFPQTTAS